MKDSGKVDSKEVKKLKMDTPKAASKKEVDWFLTGTDLVVTEQQAQKEVLDWLNANQFSGRKRMSNKDLIENLVAGMMEGDLVLNETMNFVQKLVGTNDTLTYSKRVPPSLLASTCKANKIDPEDGNARLSAAASIMTGQPAALMLKMEGDDRELRNSIALFFI
jgi:hypothetical protein